ncbi:hypothetical protein PG985_008616 [Apiospora marii]|uniref:F-box domain-containing protein n=1 Tax=Apiospora marii TaxID=335849 RepID=A0ABR1R3A4_9PEZI
MASNAPDFLGYPNEIVFSILTFCSPADLLSLSRVNKRLNELGNRVIYSSVQFTWTTLVTPPVIIFLRSILSRPQLAEHVQRLTLAGDVSFYLSPNWTTPLPKLSWTEAESALDLATGLINQLQLPYTEDWISELREGTMDATVAFLLARLPKLRSLVVTENYTRESERTGAMFRSALYKEAPVSWLSGFHQLEEVSVTNFVWYGTCGDANTPHLLPFFYSPSIRSLNLLLDDPATFAWPAGTPNIMNLCTLKLQHVREPALKCILSATPNLRVLDWEFVLSECQVTKQASQHLLNPALADLDVIVDALTPVRATVVDLTIRASVIRTTSLLEPVVQVRGSLAGLVEFDKVERFAVALPFLAGEIIPNNAFRISERVPRNIRTLVIRNDLYIYTDEFWIYTNGSYSLENPDFDPDWDEMALYQNLRSWFYEWRGTTNPHFRHLEMIVMDDWADQGMRQTLRDLCAEDRVQVELTFTGKPSWLIN